MKEEFEIGQQVAVSNESIEVALKSAYARLAESLEMSLDNGKTWVPCGELK